MKLPRSREAVVSGFSAPRWIGEEVPPGHFFEGERRLGRLAPFIVAGFVPFLVLGAVGSGFGDWQVQLAALICAGVIASVPLVPWERLPSWTQMVPILAIYPVIALLRDAAGAKAAVFEPLVIVPLALVAIYGTRADLLVTVAALAATIALPPLLIDDPAYGDEQIVRAVLASVVAATTGIAVQSLVSTTRALAIEGRAILTSSQDAFIAVTTNATIIEWNPRAEAMFGWSRSEAIGRNLLDTIASPDDRHKAEKQLRRLREEGGQLPGSRIEGRAVRRDGSAFPVEMTVSTIKVGGRKTINGFVHDISERKNAQRALQRAEERFRLAFEDNRVGMVLLTPAGKFERVNEAFSELLDRSQEELVGVGFEEIAHPDDVESNAEAMAEMAEGKRHGHQAERRCLHSRGDYVWTSCNVSPIRDERGRLLHFIAQIEDITDRKEQVDRLTHQAMHDPLTSLPNRVLFADRVRVASGRRESGSFAVIFIDLDNFKPINDTYGHTAGDQVLVEVSRRLETRLREGDTLARLGGDEFAVLCEDTDEESARLVAERVIAAFERPFAIGDHSVLQAASIGLAIQPCDAGARDPEQVLRFADLAMYRAKAAGKSRYAVFEGGMGEGQPDRGGLEGELRRGIAEGELTVHYQPQVNLESGEVTGAEALVRWQHPERGLLEPAEFMFVAEDSELIVALDDFVLWDACHQAARWRRHLGPDREFVISVNLSQRRLAEPGLSNRIAQTISEAELPAEALCLEVTESAVLDRRSDTLYGFPDVERLGVRLLIDNFGVAISSFASIQRLPRLSAIKIDSSFVAGLGRSAEDSTGVAAIIGLAHGLSLTATAAWVETPEQLAVLRELGCDYAQGYHFARPQPAGAFAGLLASASYGEMLG